LQVFVEEELGIGEARTDHAFVAQRICCGSFDSILAMPMNFSVSLPFEVQHREELLIGFHGGDQRFLRHAQELALEAAGDRPAAIRSGSSLPPGCLIDARRAAGTRRRFHQGADAFAALIRIDQHFTARSASM
jgi:hypothetical protein